MAALGDNLRALRPDLNWDRRRTGARRASRSATARRPARWRRSPTWTTCSTSSARSTPAPPWTTSTSRRSSASSGRSAADDVRRLRELERELRRQGWVTRDADGLTLSPKALRRLGGTALRHGLRRPGRPAGGASTTCATPARPASSPAPSRRWEFGDEQPLDVVRTVGNAVRAPGRRRAPPPCTLDGRGLRGRRDRAAGLGGGRALRRPVVLDGRRRPLGPDEADRAGAVAPGRHPVPAGRAADHRLRPVRDAAVPGRAGRGRAGLVQGTNLQHALQLAGRHLRRHSGVRAGRAGRHRRRADRAPGPTTATRSSTGRRCPETIERDRASRSTS